MKDRYLRHALERTGGNRAEAARLLNIPRANLLPKISQVQFMSEESARNGSWHAKSGRQTAIFGRTPILNADTCIPP